MIGALLDQRYRVVKELGQGGMATVYLARDEKNGIDVAIKIFFERESERERFGERFKREFMACARIRHPNVIRLFNFGELEGLGLYYTMEYVRGENLRTVLKREGRLSAKNCLNIMLQTASALTAFHNEGIYHRDLKPANMLLSEDERGGLRVVIMDFGLARDEEQMTLTATGMMLGTPQYMSPELFQGLKVDGRSDIFQLGAIAYEMLSGRKVWRAKDLPEFIQVIQSTDPEPLENAAPGIDERWYYIIGRCLERDPGMRYPCAEDLVLDLERLREGLPVPSPVLPGPVPVPELTRRAPLKRRMHLVIGIFFAFCIILTAFLLLRNHRAPDISYSVHNFSIQSGLQKLFISWESEKPYVSRAYIEGPEGSVCKESSSGRQTLHRLEISGLSQATPYTVRIVFPDGSTSLPKQVETKRADFRLIYARTRGGRVEIKWSAFPAGAYQVIVSSDGGLDRVYDSTTAEDGVRVVALPELSADTTELRFVLALPNGDNITTKMSDILAKEISRVSPRFDRLDPCYITSGLARSYKDAIASLATRVKGEDKEESERRTAREKKKKTAAASFIRERLEKLNILDDYRRICELTPLIFGTRLCSRKLRENLYRRLCVFWAIELFAASKEIPFAFDAHPVLSDRSFGKKALAGSRPVLQLFDRYKQSLRIGQLGILHLRAFKEKWTTVFRLTDLAGENECFQLRFLFSGLDRSILNLKINDRFIGFIYEPANLFGKGRPDTYLYQRLPDACLHQGDNTMEISAKRLFGDVDVNTCKLHSVSLLIGRDSRRPD